MLAHGRWFSPGTPASSTTKTGRHEIAEILLKVAFKHQKSNQSNQSWLCTGASIKSGGVKLIAMAQISPLSL